MPEPLTPSAREALAYVQLVGHMPPGIHMHTWSLAFQCCCVSSRPYKTADVKDGVEDYKESELWEAHEALLAAGFAFRGTKGITGRNRRYLEWERVDENVTGFKATYRFSSGKVYVCFNRLVEGRERYDKDLGGGTKKSGWIPETVKREIEASALTTG